MGWLDKLLGRTKKAAGDVTGDSSLRHEGEHQEQAADASERYNTPESGERPDWPPQPSR